MKKRVSALILVLVLLASPALAIFGVGDIVFDPVSYANALVMLEELIKNYEQLKAQLDLQVRMSKTVPVDMSIRYRTPGTMWYPLQLPYDRFGNLGGWLDAANHGSGALLGYQDASLELRSFGTSFTQLAPDEQLKTASQYASEELADGANIHSLETIGMLRGNADAVEKSIQSLESDSLSHDPKMNTEIAVLNKINAAFIANLRSARDTNRALLSVIEQQVVDSKRRRDADVAEINVQIMRLEYGAEASAKHTSTLGNALQTFRWR